VGDSQLDGLFLGIAEDDFPESRGGGIVHVDDGLLSASDRVDCPADQIFSCGGKNLQASCQGPHGGSGN
jgi:hypothetical protein